MTDQNIATLDYDLVTTTVTPSTLSAEYRLLFDPANGNKAKIELWMSLDSNAVAQTDTVTITPGVAGDEYAIAIIASGITQVYRHKQVAADTAATIAAFLAKIIDTNPAVRATANNGVITIKSAIAGSPFATDDVESTTPANLAVTTTVANAGTAKHRKISEVDITHNINSKGFEAINVNGNFYDGSATPIGIQPFGPIVVSTAPRSLSQIITNQAL